MSETAENKPTILVVDDSRLMRVAARKILQNDFEVLVAEDGEVALQTLQDDNRIMVVISDLSMPNLDGLGLLKKIRESDQPRLRELPIIIVTGAEDDDGSKTTALAAGASDFITKPFESVQLLARAQAQVKHQHTRHALQESEAAKQKLAEQNNLDPLTGLVNKRAFIKSVEEHLSYAIRHRSELSILLLRVDKYKILFLRRGRKEAEDILCKLAALATEGRRLEDTTARIGLDTFAILLPSANRVGAAKIAQQLSDTLARQVLDSEGASPKVSISTGVSRLPASPGLQADQLLLDAMKELDAGQQTHSIATTPDRPQNTVQPSNAAIASPDAVQQALIAIGNGAQPDADTNQLARAVLPVLETWNRNHNDRYRSLIRELKTVLDITTRENTSSAATSDEPTCPV